VPEIVNQAIIHAPPERIFTLIAAAERNVEWVPDLVRSERLTPGPTRVGTRFRFVTRIPGLPIPMTVTDEVKALEPNRLIRFRGVEGVGHAGYWQFEPQPPDASGRLRTLVTYAMEFDLPPGIGPLVAKAINLHARLDEQSRACLLNLRRLLE
jgi:uncharacterized protein YndB with AHSA1/START domain